jgi:nucleolar complex protein 2
VNARAGRTRKKIRLATAALLNVRTTPSNVRGRRAIQRLAMPQSKATKKFEKKHLKDTIKRRNDFKKIKQKIQVKEKRKARKAKENADADGEKPSAEDVKSRDASNKALADMSVDEFFATGLDIPKANGKDAGKPKAGKRKRDEPDNSVEAQEQSDQSDDGSEDEYEGHKQQLEALAENDPEFYQHLKENEPELLDFADDADLAGIHLSESEDEAPKSKKQKTGKKGKDTAEEDSGARDSDEVTSAMIAKWHTLLSEKHSLRQMREVVLAFRAAVRSNDAGEMTFKYNISNPDGMIAAHHVARHD